MTIDWVHAMFIDDHADVSPADLPRASSLSEHELRERIKYGAFPPVEAGVVQRTMCRRRACCLPLALAATLEDAHSVAVVLRLVQRIKGSSGKSTTARAAS